LHAKLDDGDEEVYLQRMQLWSRKKQQQLERKRRLEAEANGEGELQAADDDEERLSEEIETGNVTIDSSDSEEKDSFESNNEQPGVVVRTEENEDENEAEEDQQRSESKVNEADGGRDEAIEASATTSTATTGEWNCASCTYINSLKSAVCTMCGRRRPRLQPTKSAFDLDELVDVDGNEEVEKDGEYRQDKEAEEEEMDVDIETVEDDNDHETTALRATENKKKRGRPASQTKAKAKKKSEVMDEDEDFDANELIIDPDEGEEVLFSGGYRLPAQLYDNLFDYQKTGVRWMWELHRQNAGGIIGDEMVHTRHDTTRTHTRTHYLRHGLLIAWCAGAGFGEDGAGHVVPRWASSQRDVERTYTHCLPGDGHAAVGARVPQVVAALPCGRPPRHGDVFGLGVRPDRTNRYRWYGAAPVWRWVELCVRAGGPDVVACVLRGCRACADHDL
jgi:hypothetical protein